MSFGGDVAMAAARRSKPPGAAACWLRSASQKFGPGARRGAVTVTSSRPQLELGYPLADAALHPIARHRVPAEHARGAISRGGCDLRGERAEGPGDREVWDSVGVEPITAESRRHRIDGIDEVIERIRASVRGRGARGFTAVAQQPDGGKVAGARVVGELAQARAAHARGSARAVRAAGRRLAPVYWSGWGVVAGAGARAFAGAAPSSRGARGEAPRQSWRALACAGPACATARCGALRSPPHVRCRPARVRPSRRRARAQRVG